jgi:hypothetical protein
LLLLLLMRWRSSKNQKNNIMNEPNSFLTILLMRWLTVALSLHTYGKSCIALIQPAAVQDPSPKKKKKVGSGVAEEKMGVRRRCDDHEKRRWVCSVWLRTNPSLQNGSNNWFVFVNNLVINFVSN